MRRSLTDRIRGVSGRVTEMMLRKRKCRPHLPFQTRDNREVERDRDRMRKKFSEPVSEMDREKEIKKYSEIIREQTNCISTIIRVQSLNSGLRLILLYMYKNNSQRSPNTQTVFPVRTTRVCNSIMFISKVNMIGYCAFKRLQRHGLVADTALGCFLSFFLPSSQISVSPR